jgi:hypothetical protein
MKGREEDEGRMREGGREGFENREEGRFVVERKE